jgi:hypothetical protein
LPSSRDRSPTRSRTRRDRCGCRMEAAPRRLIDSLARCRAPTPPCPPPTNGGGIFFL